MEELLSVLFEIVGDFLLQFLMETLFGSVGEAVGKATRPKGGKPPVPRPFWVRLMAAAIFGAAAGGISLLGLPSSLLKSDALRLASLIVSPLLAGLTMAAIGRWRENRNRPRIALQRFSTAWLFAFALAGVRFFFARG
jgi:hypothetical protein